MHKMNEIVNKFLLGGDKFMPEIHLTLFRMGFFGAAPGWGGGAFWHPFPKIRHTNPTMMTLGTVIPYLRKIQKI